MDAPRSVIVDAGFRIDANAAGGWKRAGVTHGIVVPSYPRAFVVVDVARIVGDASSAMRPSITHRSRSLGCVIRRGSPRRGHVDESRMVVWIRVVRCHVWLDDTPILFTHVHITFLWDGATTPRYRHC